MGFNKKTGGWVLTPPPRFQKLFAYMKSTICLRKYILKHRPTTLSRLQNIMNANNLLFKSDFLKNVLLKIAKLLKLWNQLMNKRCLCI